MQDTATAILTALRGGVQALLITHVCALMGSLDLTAVSSIVQCIAIYFLILHLSPEWSEIGWAPVCPLQGLAAKGTRLDLDKS